MGPFKLMGQTDGNGHIALDMLKFSVLHPDLKGKVHVFQPYPLNFDTSLIGHVLDINHLSAAFLDRILPTNSRFYRKIPTHE